MTRARILVIEDDHARGPELQDRLNAAGYEVLHASLSDSNLIEHVSGLHPDLVLMDIGVRGKTDGVRTADIIQSRLEIPVIYMMSSQAYGQATLQRSKATGPFGYIFEPLDTKQLTTTVEVALVRNRLEREIKQNRQWLSTVLKSIGDGVVAVDERRHITFINPVAAGLTGWTAAEAAGKPLEEVFRIGGQDSRAMVEAAFGRASRESGSGQEGSIHAVLRARTKEEIPVEITVSRITSDDVTSGMVLVFRDVTERRRAMEEIQRHADRAEALAQVASQLTKQTELNSLLQTVCESTNRALRATGTAVFLLEPKTDVFRLRAAYSEVVLLRALTGSDFEVDRETLEGMLTRAKPVSVIRSVQANQVLPYWSLLSRLRLNTLILAALFIRDELLGVLASVFAENRTVVSEDDLELLTGLSDQASTAIENAELFEQVRRGRERQRLLAKSLVQVQESERRHVARELHDQLGQALTGLQFMLEGAKGHVQEEHRSDLDEIQKYVGNIMEQTRELSLNLRPSMLDDLGLVPTLRWHFDRYSRQTGIQVDFRCKVTGERFPADIETAAYRIIQEALTNIARHAQVKEAVVELAAREGTLWLEVLDRGKGFDPSSDSDKPTSGVGGMRERAGLVGGYLVVHSYPGRGTQVVAALPLKGQTLERRQYERNRPAGR